MKRYTIKGSIPGAAIMKGDPYFPTEKVFGETNDLDEAKAIAENNVQIYKTEWRSYGKTILREEKKYPIIYINNKYASRPVDCYFYDEKKKLWMHIEGI